MSKKRVVRFLVRLMGDPSEAQKFQRAPKRILAAAGLTLAAAGLTAAERDLVLSGDDGKLRAFLAAEADESLAASSNLRGVRTAAIKEVTLVAAIKEVTKVAAIKEVTKVAAIKEVTKVAAIKEVTRVAAIKEVTKVAAIKEVTRRGSDRES